MLFAAPTRGMQLLTPRPAPATPLLTAGKNVTASLLDSSNRRLVSNDLAEGWVGFSPPGMLGESSSRLQLACSGAGGRWFLAGGVACCGPWEVRRACAASQIAAGHLHAPLAIPPHAGYFYNNACKAAQLLLVYSTPDLSMGLDLFALDTMTAVGGGVHCTVNKWWPGSLS